MHAYACNSVVVLPAVAIPCLNSRSLSARLPAGSFWIRSISALRRRRTSYYVVAVAPGSDESKVAAGWHDGNVVRVISVVVTGGHGRLRAAICRRFQLWLCACCLDIGAPGRPEKTTSSPGQANTTQARPHARIPNTATRCACFTVSRVPGCQVCVRAACPN